MLSQDICQKLKDAGFPQPFVIEEGRWYSEGRGGVYAEHEDQTIQHLPPTLGTDGDPDDVWYDDPEDMPELIYAPTIEELLRELYDPDKMLLMGYVPEKGWGAEREPGKPWGGESLEEALANLWLQTNSTT